MHINENQAILTDDNHVEIFTDGRKKFERLFQDIEEAKVYIHIQYYIIRRDELGKKLISLLTKSKRRREGPVYDELGSRQLTKGFSKHFEAGGEARPSSRPSRASLICV